MKTIQLQVEDDNYESFLTIIKSYLNYNQTQFLYIIILLIYSLPSYDILPFT